MSWTKDKSGNWVWTPDGKGNPNKAGDNVTPPPTSPFAGGATTDTSGLDSSYKVDLGFGLTDSNGKPISLPPIQIKAYIATLAGTNPAQYNKVKAAVSRLTGKSKLDPDYVGGYVSKLAQNIMASSDIIARTGSIEDYFNTAAKAAGATQSPPQSYVSSPTQAKSNINTAFNNLLGRDATDKEIKALTGILNDAEKKNPSRYVNGVTYGGLDKNQFLIDLITSGKYDANPKSYPKTLVNIAKEAAAYKASAEAKKAGKVEASELADRQAILTTAINNDIHLTDDAINSYMDTIRKGKDVTAVQQELRNIAALSMPENVAKMIQSGTDLSAIYSPYRSRMASVLELPVNQIDMKDPALRSAITADGAQTLYDFERNLRKDNRWQYTNQAHDEVASAATQVLRDFGFMG